MLFCLLIIAVFVAKIYHFTSTFLNRYQNLFIANFCILYFVSNFFLLSFLLKSNKRFLAWSLEPELQIVIFCCFQPSSYAIAFITFFGADVVFSSAFSFTERCKCNALSLFPNQSVYLLVLFFCCFRCAICIFLWLLNGSKNGVYILIHSTIVACLFAPVVATYLHEPPMFCIGHIINI